MVIQVFENGPFCQKTQIEDFRFNITATILTNMKVLSNEIVCFDHKNKCAKNEVCTSNHFGTAST